MTSLAVGALAVAAGAFGVAQAGASPAPPDTKVITSQAAYTRAELQAVARRLADSAEGRALGLTEVSVNSDGSGVRVGVTAEVPSQDEQRALARFAGLPASAITYEADVNLVNLPATRIDQD